jgi:hypothetical protein
MPRAPVITFAQNWQLTPQGSGCRFQGGAASWLQFHTIFGSVFSLSCSLNSMASSIRAKRGMPVPGMLFGAYIT